MAVAADAPRVAEYTEPAEIAEPAESIAPPVVGRRPVTHQNNFDVIRLGAAFLVLFGHSYVLNGLPEYLFLSWLPLGPLGVYIFFTMSGYLVVESWRRDPHLLRFLARRSLRIFPGLVVCVLVTILVLGPLMTTLSWREYLGHEVSRMYVWNIALYPIFTLPGLFEQNVLRGVVNGSIWSLPVEFLMYLVVCVVGVLRGNRWVFLAIGIASAALCQWWAHAATTGIVFYGSDLRQVVLCGTYFWAGAVIREFNLSRHFSSSGTVVAIVALLVLEPWTELLRAAAWVLLPMAVLGFGADRSPSLTRLTRTGDYSYGVYIYAFPTQQTVAALWPGLPIGWYIPIVSVIVLALAVASWHLVEHPALQWKPRSRAR